MLKKRSKFENRPFYLIGSNENVDSIFIIWNVNGMYVPFRQIVPNGRWIPMEELAHAVAGHAFNNVCIFFEDQFAVQTKPAGLDRKNVRDRAWQKFKDNIISSRLLKSFHDSLKLAQYKPSREGKWHTRFEIGILYALNPYVGQRRLQTKWEKAYSLWYPDDNKKIMRNNGNGKIGFKSSSEAWQDLRMLGSIKNELDKKVKLLKELRDEIAKRNSLVEVLKMRKVQMWRLGVAALYLLNPLVMREGQIQFLLDIWEDDYFGVSI